MTIYIYGTFSNRVYRFGGSKVRILVPIIQQLVQPETVVHSDKWQHTLGYLQEDIHSFISKSLPINVFLHNWVVGSNY